MFRKPTKIFFICFAGILAAYISITCLTSRPMASLSVPGKYRICQTSYWYVPEYKIIGKIVGPLIYPKEEVIWASTIPIDINGNTIIITWKPMSTILLRHEFGHAIQVCDKGPWKFYTHYYLNSRYRLIQELDAQKYAFSIQAAIEVKINYPSQSQP